MSLLAGFDIVTEFSPTLVLESIKSIVQVQGNFINPPFEILIPISQDITVGGQQITVTGSEHIIVRDIEINLNDDDTITLSFIFYNGSIFIESPSQISMSILEGTLEIISPISLQPNLTNPNCKSLAVDLNNSITSINYTQDSENRIRDSLAGTGITYNDFINFSNQAISAFVRNLGFQTLSTSFDVIQGQNGRINPTLQYEHLEVHCIANEDRNKQALGLFGILILANHSNGNHSLKTETAIPDNSNTCMSISPQVFHELIFCPAIAESFGKSLPELPKTCANSSGFDLKGFKVTKIADNFNLPPLISLEIFAEKSGFCYDAEIKLLGFLTFTVSDGTLEPHLILLDPITDVDMPWYCHLVSFLLFGAIGLAVTITLDVIAEPIANSIAKSLLDSSLIGAGLESVSLPPHIIYEHVTINQLGLRISGTKRVILPDPVRQDLILDGSVVTTETEILSQGIYTSTHCITGDFPYTEVAQQQVATFQAIPTLLGRPLDLEWSLRIGSDYREIILQEENDTVSISNIETRYVFPLRAGTKVQQDVQIGYSINNDTITLTNLPEQGNYDFILRVRGTDPMGNVEEGGMISSFEGNGVVFENNFIELMEECLRDALKGMRESSTLVNEKIIPPWVPVNMPVNEVMASFIDTVIKSNHQDADNYLLSTMLVHGSSFINALSSRQTQTYEVLEEIERSGTNVSLEKAAHRLKSSRKPRKVLKVPQKEMKAVAAAMKKGGVGGTVKNNRGTKRRSVSKK